MLGEKQDDGLVSQDDEVFSSPLVTKEYVKQHLQEINTLKISVLGYLTMTI